MPLAGKGMLLTSMDIDPSDEAEFNRWYDREHLEERVAIDGFLEARRYVARNASVAVQKSASWLPRVRYAASEPRPHWNIRIASVLRFRSSQTRAPQYGANFGIGTLAPKYLCLYSTATIDVLESAAYRARLANPTDWSRRTMARFKNMIRAVGRITVSRGQGRGAVLGIVRFRPQAGHEAALRATLTERLDPVGLDGIISMHLIESDPALSGPTTEIPAAAAAASPDWFVLIDGTSAETIAAALANRFTGTSAPDLRALQISSGIYDLMWDLAKSDIPQR
jgi:hypothetical protein